MTKSAIALNKAGIEHVKSQLKRFELDWDLDATCAEIEDEVDFYNAHENGCVYEDARITIWIEPSMVVTA